MRNLQLILMALILCCFVGCASADESVIDVNSSSAVEESEDIVNIVGNTYNIESAVMAGEDVTEDNFSTYGLENYSLTFTDNGVKVLMGDMFSDHLYEVIESTDENGDSQIEIEIDGIESQQIILKDTTIYYKRNDNISYVYELA